MTPQAIDRDTATGLAIGRALADLGPILQAEAVEADGAWQAWLAEPAFQRRQWPEIEPALDMRRRWTLAELQAFARNPRIVLPFEVDAIRQTIDLVIGEG